MSLRDDLTKLYDSWPEDQEGLRRAFGRLTGKAASLEGAASSLVSRPGVSHSFRTAPASPGGRSRPVFFLADVVAPAADSWFLSVCYYEDEISDPEELGNAIPEGLFGETGYCFDVDDDEPELLQYLEKRMDEAHSAAGRDAGGRRLDADN